MLYHIHVQYIHIHTVHTVHTCTVHIFLNESHFYLCSGGGINWDVIKYPGDGLGQAINMHYGARKILFMGIKKPFSTKSAPRNCWLSYSTGEKTKNLGGDPPSLVLIRTNYQMHEMWHKVNLLNVYALTHTYNILKFKILFQGCTYMSLILLSAKCLADSPA